MIFYVYKSYGDRWHIAVKEHERAFSRYLMQDGEIRNFTSVKTNKSAREAISVLKKYYRVKNEKISEREMALNPSRAKKYIRVV